MYVHTHNQHQRADSSEGSNIKILPTIKNAYLIIEQDTIVDNEPMSDCTDYNAEQVIRCQRQNGAACPL